MTKAWSIDLLTATRSKSNNSTTRQSSFWTDTLRKVMSSVRKYGDSKRWTFNR